jgi:hypothetical protein
MGRFKENYADVSITVLIGDSETGRAPTRPGPASLTASSFPDDLVVVVPVSHPWRGSQPRRPGGSRGRTPHPAGAGIGHAGRPRNGADPGGHEAVGAAHRRGDGGRPRRSRRRCGPASGSLPSRAWRWRRSAVKACSGVRHLTTSRFPAHFISPPTAIAAGRRWRRPSEPSSKRRRPERSRPGRSPACPNGGASWLPSGPGARGTPAGPRARSPAPRPASACRIP